MRLTRTLATGAVVLSALVTLTGCGGDSEAAPDGPLGGLPAANTMADVQKAITERGEDCSPLEKSREGQSYMEDEAEDPAWGIKERAVCSDKGGSPVTVLLIGDMAKFQESLAKDGGSFTVGQNFALAGESENFGATLNRNGLRTLSCDPDAREKVPSGYEIHEGQVKGCFTTNYDA
ncbi:hypothetical protein E2C00_22375 [Streptomyces sp. WAC05374]|uniref:hypothetical protein n=1 Tax=Streptomyces sp. WAC05374 TaxID=2487420 RepID=UPI000F86B87B|nr:hypothetical protein [Streptomyces sp. WAC05374]RST16155.1 hypothetical protein EF905_13080 [Streptomyces sp. WAC05374]TDF46007.1 hypothetical protein E2B92_11380 [Streptomyces sp. WAC05374]TDF53001.1 hypothetical protein E2C00_22375 [Streptomyces sp. WAC05374]TDF58215.1 hypothetical protein E2C02_06770 [Streptomyces sp. WAC05374]